MKNKILKLHIKGYVLYYAVFQDKAEIRRFLHGRKNRSELAFPTHIDHQKAEARGLCFFHIYPHISRISQAMPPLSNTSTSAHVRRRPAPAVPGFITFTPPISS